MEPGKLLDLVVEAFDAANTDLFEKTIILRAKLMDVVSHSLVVFVLGARKQDAARMVDWTFNALCRLDAPCSQEVVGLLEATCKVATRLLSYDMCFLARRSASDMSALIGMTDQANVSYDVSVGLRDLYKHSTPAWNYAHCASDPKLGAMVLAFVGVICTSTNVEAVKASCMAVLEQVLTVIHAKKNQASNTASNKVSELILCTSHNTTVVATAFRFVSYYDACTAMDFLIKLSKLATKDMWHIIAKQARQSNATWVLLKRLARRNSSKTWALIKQFAQNDFWNVEEADQVVEQAHVNYNFNTQVGANQEMSKHQATQALLAVMKAKLVVSSHPTPSEWVVVSHASSVLSCVSSAILEKDAESLLSTSIKTLMMSRQTTPKTFDQNLCLVVLIQKLLGLAPSDSTVQHVADWLIRNKLTCMTFAMSAAFCDLARAVKACNDSLSAQTIACLAACMEYRATKYTTSPNPALLALASLEPSLPATLLCCSPSSSSSSSSCPSSLPPLDASLWSTASPTSPELGESSTNHQACESVLASRCVAKPLKRKLGLSL